MNIDEIRINVPFECGESHLCQNQNFIKKIWGRYRKWKRTKEDCRLLLEMSDYYLQDMGLSRADAVRFSRQRDSLWTVIFKNPKDGTCQR
ncbi:DUF1127 domain-containing protein [Desulfospira joergensenii]|uniref:DUF1127 domain-containing protein n=1 Tax=Desulfospira joergensenii TaxID=53329 RepID=UPI0003B471A4